MLLIALLLFAALDLALSFVKGYSNMEKEWYVVNTYSGHESKVKEKLEMRTESMGMQDYIYRVIIQKPQK